MYGCLQRYDPFTVFTLNIGHLRVSFLRWAVKPLSCKLHFVIAVANVTVSQNKTFVKVFVKLCAGFGDKHKENEKILSILTVYNAKILVYNVREK